MKHPLTEGQQVDLITPLCLCVQTKRARILLYLFFANVCVCLSEGEGGASLPVCAQACINARLISPYLTWTSPGEKPQYFQTRKKNRLFG